MSGLAVVLCGRHQHPQYLLSKSKKLFSLREEWGSSEFFIPEVPTRSALGGLGLIYPTSPLISIVAHLHQTDTLPPQVEFIYATKSIDGEILFADRLLHIASNRPQQVKLHFFLTGSQSGGAAALQDSRLAELAISPSYRRLNTKDVLEALSSSGREQTVCYVCGPPQMTDELVDLLRGQEGMSADRVLCEKWW